MASSPALSDASITSGEDNDQDHEDTNADDSNANKASAAKDKECQYCHQKFTSSSLGRHLDQFISKKKADGIHNVDEIRRLRSGITRRTARNSTKKEHDEQQILGGQSPGPQYSLPSYSELVNKTATKEDIRFNRANWQATGVITDATILPTPPAIAVASPAIVEQSANTAAGQKRSYSIYAADVQNAATSETTRALELSLREVLDAVRLAARKAAPKPQPFDFHFESQTFPYLCLALLAAPPTLFQSTPFATVSSVPLSSPGIDQYQTLRKAISLKIDTWKWHTLAYIQRNSPPGSTIAEELDSLNEQTQTYMETCMAHVDAAYQNFTSFGIEQRESLWTIELLRAFKTEQDKVKDAKAAVERITQEMRQLQQQLDHLSRCQWPREMALWPPDRPTFDSATQDELRKLNMLRGSSTSGDTPSSNSNMPETDELARHDDRWDYDRLVTKWRKHVREDRSRKTGVQASAQMSQPGQPPPSDPMHSNSPKALSSSTPRIGSSLYKSATMPEYGTRPASAGLPLSNEGSPQILNGAGVSIGGINGLPPSINPAQSASSTTSSAAYSIPPPPRSRPLGIISDVDEYYAPRLMGFRRDPPKQ